MTTPCHKVMRARTSNEQGNPLATEGGQPASIRACGQSHESHGHAIGYAVIVVALLLFVVGEFLGTDLGGPCPNNEGIFPRDCPDKYRSLAP